MIHPTSAASLSVRFILNRSPSWLSRFSRAASEMTYVVVRRGVVRRRERGGERRVARSRPPGLPKDHRIQFPCPRRFRRRMVNQQMAMVDTSVGAASGSSNLQKSKIFHAQRRSYFPRARSCADGHSLSFQNERTRDIRTEHPPSPLSSSPLSLLWEEGGPTIAAARERPTKEFVHAPEKAVTPDARTAATKSPLRFIVFPSQCLALGRVGA